MAAKELMELWFDICGGRRDLCESNCDWAFAAGSDDWNECLWECVDDYYRCMGGIPVVPRPPWDASWDVAQWGVNYTTKDDPGAGWQGPGSLGYIDTGYQPLLRPRGWPGPIHWVVEIGIGGFSADVLRNPGTVGY
jgi:hypothetical protein